MIDLTARLGGAAATAALAFAVMPATGTAALRSFGSTLTAPANVTEARQADTAYWQTTLPGGASPRSPATGQIKSFKVKGIAKSSWKTGMVGGERMFHLQSLRKRSNGTYKILVTSQAFFLPGNGTNPQKVTTFRPINFCIKKGDSLVLNTVGGWSGTSTGPYAMGTPLQIFSNVPGASVAEYTKADGTNNGDTIRANAGPGKNHELLMRLTVGTAQNATGLCPGGTGR